MCKRLDILKVIKVHNYFVVVLNLQEGDIYMVSYPNTISVMRGKSEETTSNESEEPKIEMECYGQKPITCILYEKLSGELVPIAIQMTNDVTEGPQVVTPSDDKKKWQLAKQRVLSADAQVHLFVSRYLHGNLIMEAIAMATLRNIPPSHPVYKILVPHLRNIIAVNAWERSSNFGARKLSETVLGLKLPDTFLKMAYKDFHISDFNLPKFLMKYGLDETDKLHNYHYYKDGLFIWNTLQKFVLTILQVYETDDDVRDDTLLFNWLIDLQRNGLPNWEEEGGDHGIPLGFHNTQELADFLTSIIFTATCRHAAITAGLIDYMPIVVTSATKISMASHMSIDGASELHYDMKQMAAALFTITKLSVCSVSTLNFCYYSAKDVPNILTIFLVKHIQL